MNARCYIIATDNEGPSGPSFHFTDRHTTCPPIGPIYDNNMSISAKILNTLFGLRLR
jgi:hypothetical protein